MVYGEHLNCCALYSLYPGQEQCLLLFFFLLTFCFNIFPSYFLPLVIIILVASEEQDTDQIFPP